MAFHFPAIRLIWSFFATFLSLFYHPRLILKTKTAQDEDAMKEKRRWIRRETKRKNEESLKAEKILCVSACVE